MPRMYAPLLTFVPIVPLLALGSSAFGQQNGASPGPSGSPPADALPAPAKGTQPPPSPWAAAPATTADAVEKEAALAAESAAQEKTATATTGMQVSPSGKGLVFQNGEFKWKFGGYIKVDAIHDFDEIGSADSFDPRTIPTGDTGLEGDNTRFHARQTRFNVDVTGPTSAGDFRAFVEGDFFSDQNGFRLRHAYGTIDHFLGGQTWSTFMDEDAMPETLDFESPIAFPLIRQAQIRYTEKYESGNYWAVSLEDPASTLIPPAGVDGSTQEPLPDLNARFRWKNSRGHVQLGAFTGMASFDPVDGSPDDEWLWGFNLSTKLATTGEDSAIAQVTYGDGVGRYRGGITAAPDGDGNMEAVETWGWLLSYEHHWSPKYRSTLSYAWADANLPGGAPADTTQKLDYLALNLIWQFCDRAWTGIEYLYGSNETFDEADGNASRVQISLRFDI
jgi:hypothetical protein